MLSIKFTCEIITPMFIGNASTQETELRPPAIKAALRFWWRAMQGESNIPEMKKQEATIFGGSDDGMGKSCFFITIDKQPTQPNDNQTFWDEFPRESQNQRFINPYYGQYNMPGAGFLLYSTFTSNKRRKYFKPNDTFQFSLFVKDKTHLFDVILSLYALQMFGNLGSRARRGAGSFRVIEYEINGGQISGESQELLGKLTEEFVNLVAIQDAYQTFAKYCNLSSSPAKYSVLKGSKICISAVCNDWKSAMNQVGKKYEDFRGKNKSRVWETPYFGFPILHGRGQDSQTFLAAKYDAIGKRFSFKKDDIVERRSSPVVFKFIKGKHNKIYPIVFVLSGEFLPNGYELTKKQNRQIEGNANISTRKSNQLVDDFLNSLTAPISFEL